MRSLYLPTATHDVVWFVVGSPWALLGLWVLLVSIVTFFVFGIDKWKAKRSSRRVRERTLFLLAAIGGSIGAWLGMKVWHHKTLHKSFRFGIPAILFLQLALVAGLFIYFNFIR